MSSSRIIVNPGDATSGDAFTQPTVTGPSNDFQQPPPLRVRLICELIGTCFFILFGAGCAAKLNPPDLLTVSVAHALTAMWLIYVFGPVSGGHFNAGPTIAFAFDGKMSIVEILGYLAAQGVGSLIAGALLLALYGTDSKLGTPGLSPGTDAVHGFAIEFICTTILSFVICFTTSYHTHKEASFPIGLTVLSCFLIGADRDGAALNPWRWFGPAVASRTFNASAWIYIVGPIGGFILGYGLFRLYKLIWNGSSYRRFE